MHLAYASDAVWALTGVAKATKNNSDTKAKATILVNLKRMALFEALGGLFIAIGERILQ